MAMTFLGRRGRGIDWWRELAPVLAVAGLAADYLSPAQTWTILLPFGSVALLMMLRRWALAGAVFLLSSWVAIPLAAGAVCTVEELSGERRLYVIDGVTLPTLDDATPLPMMGSVGFTRLPVGPGHLLNPRWALRDAIVTFADLHNAMVIERVLQTPCGGFGDGR